MKFRIRNQPAVLCGLFLLQDLVEGFRLGLHGSLGRSSRLRRRGNISGITSLTDSTDVRYSTNITLNGQNFQTLIDTGSSDLWVAGTVSNAQDTGQSSGVSYAVGQVQGPIKIAQLQLSGFSIDSQAYLEISPDQNNVGGQGLIGLGPNTGSQILTTIGNSTGYPPLDNIFRQDTSTPNYLTILLSRSDDPDERFPGDLTIGEVVLGYESILNQPKISVTQVPTGYSDGQHWQVLLDANGIIGPNGKAIPVTSTVQGTTDTSRATVIFDSGFSLPQVPKSVSDAIYSGITGAQLTNISGLGEIYTLPCNQEINITFVFSGVHYPINPLDTVMNGTDLGITVGTGQDVCIGAFQPVSFDSSFGSGSGPLFDMILGMGFLRNAYLLVDYGDFVGGSTTTAAPYVQLLSMTNNSAATHQDFVNVRLGGNGTVTDNGGGNSGSASTTLFNSRRIAIIAGAAGLGLLILIASCCFCCLRRRGARQTATGGIMGFGGQSYQPLHDPAPNAASETHALPNLGYNEGHYGQVPPGYGPYGGQQQYQTAWDHRY